MKNGLKEKVVARVEMTDLPTFSYTSTSEIPTLYIPEAENSVRYIIRSTSLKTKPVATKRFYVDSLT